MNPIIEHQTQPTYNSCVSTCIAMIMDVPAKQIIDKYHEAYFDDQEISLRDILNDLDLEFEAFYSLDSISIQNIGVYLCTTPSLNIEGGTHQIIIECTSDNYYVFDPAKGVEDKKYYAPKDRIDGNLARQLGGFIVDCYIPYESILKARGLK